MYPRQTVIMRQLQPVALLVAIVAVVMSVFNLVYLTESQMHNIELQLALQQGQIYDALEKAVLSSKDKDKDPLLAINLIILAIGLILSLLVAVRSADQLLRPMDALVNQIEKLERGDLSLQEDQQKLGTVGGNLANKLQLLGKRLAGERTELETT